MHFDTLESRRLFAVSAALDAAGTLTVQGDAADDVITVQQSYRSVTVSQGPADLTWFPGRLELATKSGPFVVADSPTLTFELRPPSFPLTSVRKIVVRGGAGRDTIVINSSIPADVRGEGGNDVVYGGFGDDTIDGGADSDTLDGRAGNDVLDGGDGNTGWGWGHDVVRGGDGDDLLLADDGRDDYQGGSGRDNLSYANHVGGVYISPLDGFQVTDDPYFTGDIEDTFDPDIEVFTGTPRNDFFFGDARDNVFYGGDGNDTAWGFGGNDTLYGQAGADTLYGDDGGSGADPTWYGAPGNDTLDGGSGADQLYGDAGNDVFYTRDWETDHVDGGSGFDSAYADSLWTPFGVSVLDDLTGVEYWH